MGWTAFADLSVHRLSCLRRSKEPGRFEEFASLYYGRLLTLHGTTRSPGMVLAFGSADRDELLIEAVGRRLLPGRHC